MELKLVRKWFCDNGTIGEFSVNGDRLYYVMEDKDRKLEEVGCSAKIPKKTCIPRGRYKVVIDWSTRFQRLMPHVLDVPCFDGIRIHVGNYEGDTEGCLLVGFTYQLTPEYAVLQSKLAFSDFYPRLAKALDNKEEVWLEVE